MRNQFGDNATVTERLAALILLNQINNASLKTKATELSIAGFNRVEIANLLELTTAEVVSLLKPSRSPVKKE